MLDRKLRCFNARPTGCGTMRRYSLIRIGVALLEEVRHRRGRFGVSYAQALPNVCGSQSLLPADQGVELSAPLHHHVCLHTAMFPITMIIHQSSELCASPSQRVSFLRVAVVMVSPPSKRNPN